MLGPLSLNLSPLLKLKLKSCPYIPLNKVYGLYSCPTRILKCASKIISSPLCKLINNSIETGAYPSKLKHAKVVPVYKGEDKTDPSNYRPISLLSIFNRIFEKTMYRRLMAYLELNGILCDSQYGFRKNIQLNTH